VRSDERELRARAYELSAGVYRPAEADRLVSDLHRSGVLPATSERRRHGLVRNGEAARATGERVQL
jgi:hypothetical protein